MEMTKQRKYKILLDTVVFLWQGKKIAAKR
jgi:hypothetical protein